MPKETPIEVLITVALTEANIERLQEVSPRLHITLQPAKRADEIAAEVWTRTEILYTDRLIPAPALVPNLRWVQFHFAGIDFAAQNPLVLKPDVITTTLSGAASPQMAEFALTMMLALGHHLPAMSASQAKADWPADRWERFTARELRNSTVGIVGYGSIGRELARMLQVFNCTVLAAKHDVLHPEDPGFTLPGLGDPEGRLFTRLYPFQALQSMLKPCDYVVVLLPLTPQTRGLIGAAELAVLKPTAYLVDCGRGGIVDHTALAEALQEKRLAGAALDVFAEEPLPAASPLWRVPGLIISPHISGLSQVYRERAMEMFAANVERYLSGAALFNRFDVEKGY